MVNPLDRLKNKITGKDSGVVESVVDLARELHCISDIIGRSYEIFDADGKIIYRIKQKPMKVVQLNLLLKTVQKLRLKEEKAMKKGKR